MAVTFPVYLLKASAFCMAAFVLCSLLSLHDATRLPVLAWLIPWLLPLMVLVLSIPVAIAGIYGSTIRKIRVLTIFSRGGLLSAIISGRLLSTLFWTVYAVLSSFFMILGFQFFSTGDWLMFFTVIPVFYIAYRTFFHVLAKEIKFYLVTSLALSGAVIITPIIMLCIYALVMIGFDIPFLHYKSVASAITAHEGSVLQSTGSLIVKSISEWMAVQNGIRAYAAVHAGEVETKLSLVFYTLIAGTMIFFNAVNLLAFCLVPARELKRILLPLVPDAVSEEQKDPISGRRGIFYRLSIMLAALVSLAAGFSFLENRLSDHPGIAGMNTDARQKMIRYVERIDNMYVRPGTITQIEAYKMDLLRDLDDAALELEAAIDRAFDDMTLRVDDFLDWYYSLFAEYARIAHLVGGSAEDHLAAMLAKHLNIDHNFKHVHDQLFLLIDQNDQVGRKLADAARHLTEKNQMHADADDMEVVRTRHMADLLAYEDFMGLDFRVLSASASSGGGFLAGGLIGKKIIGNAAKKSVFKASARTLARFGGSKAIGKTSGGAMGSAAGAAAGSIVPGGGTVAGAAIGGIAGSIAGGLLMDKTMLIAEEFYSRDIFKAEIIRVIEQTRLETKARLYGG